MNLTDFEKHIDPVILARGQDYYNSGQVLSIEKTGSGVFLARVEGSESYQVQVQLSDEKKIIFSSCNCPYDQGEFCKHQVAVFLALRETPGSAGIVTGDKKNERSLQSLIEKAPRQELERVLLSLAHEHPFIKRTLKLVLEKKTMEEELKECRALIRSTVSSNGGRRGFVEYRQVRGALLGADTVAARIREYYENSDYSQAYALSLCILQELLHLVAMADDSSGYIGSMITDSLDVLTDSALHLNDKENEQAFQQLLKEVKHPRHDIFSDPKVAILELLTTITDTPKKRQALEKTIDELVENEKSRNSYSRYFEEEMAVLRCRLLSKFATPTEVEQYLIKNLHIPAIRETMIKQAMDRKDYAQAEQICLQGEADDREYRGLVKKWQSYRALILNKTGRLEEWRVLIRGFAIDGSLEAYHDYKNSFSQKEWQAMYEEFLNRIKERNRWNHFYPRLLIEESRLDLLCAHVGQYPEWIVDYAAALHSFDPSMVLSTYIRHIETKAKEASERSKYKHIAGLLQNFSSVCGPEEAQKLRTLLLQRYPRRPAMLDELRRVKL